MAIRSRPPSLPHPAEDEAVGEPELEHQPQRVPAPVPAARAGPVSDAERPAGEPPAEASLLVEARPDRGRQPLVQAGNAGEDRRADLAQRLRDQGRLGAECDRQAGGGTQELHQTGEGVRERQEEECLVAGLDQSSDAPHHLDHREVVAVGEDAALRRSGRARRVDDRERVVLADPRPRTVDGFRIGREQRSSPLPQLRQRDRIGLGLLVEHNQLLENLELAAGRGDLRQLSGVLADHEASARVPEYIGAFQRRARRVDRHHERPDRDQGPVAERPLEPRAAEDGDAVALADPKREEAGCELLNAATRVVPAHVAPLTPLLHEEGGRRPGLRQRAQPEGGERARLDRLRLRHSCHDRVCSTFAARAAAGIGSLAEARSAFCRESVGPRTENRRCP